MDRGKSVEGGPVGLFVRRGDADLLGERLDLRVVDPDGLVWEPFEVERESGDAIAKIRCVDRWRRWRGCLPGLPCVGRPDLAGGVGGDIIEGDDFRHCSVSV